MKVSKQVRFNEAYIPPRCRKARYREVIHTVTGEIKEVTRDEAPIAIIQHARGGSLGRIGRPGRIEYHWYDHRLFARVRLSHFISLNGKRDRVATVKDAHWGDEWIGVSTPEAAQEQFEKQASSYLLINGKLFVEVGEPMYCISALGLGCNHSCTYLSVDHWYNSNIPWEMYVRCDQMEKALALHKKIALGRGDTDSVPSRYHDTFEIVIPKAVRRNPKKDYGGHGDEFTNRCQSIISGVKNPAMAGLGVMIAALRP